MKYLHKAVAFLLLSLAWVADGLADTANFQASISRLDGLLQASRREPAVWAHQFVQDHVALDRVTQATFGGYLEVSLETYDDLLSGPRFHRLIAHYRDRLATAFQAKLQADLANLLANPALHGLKLENITTEGSRGQANVHALFPDGHVSLLADLIRSGKTWKIATLKIASRSVSTHYRHLYKKTIAEHYSLPVLEAQMAERDYVVLDDFTATWDGHQPMDWGAWKEKDRVKPMLYRIEQHDTRHYMTARDSTYSVILGKFVQWNPRQYPIMTWCWRANALPPGGNEFLDDANDSAAGIYVIFSQNFLGIPKQLKYVWSTTLPEGTVGRRDKIFRPWFYVVESGKNKLGQWAFETVDLEKHHKDKLGGRPAERTIGLGLLTDANSTRSYAEAYYADMRAWTRDALEGGRITDHCGGLPRQLARNARDSKPGSAYGAEE